MSFFSIGSGRAFRLIDGTSLSPRSSVTCHISSKVLEKVPRLGHSRCRKQTDVRIFQNERRTCSLISSRLRQQKPDRQDENDISERTHLALSDNTYRYYAATIRSLFFFFSSLYLHLLYSIPITGTPEVASTIQKHTVILADKLGACQ